jgi:ketosteroid isomerase-like protein
MTSAEDIDRVRRSYSAWNRGDVEQLLEAMSEDVEIVPVLGDAVSADRFRGHDGVRHWYETVHSSLDDFRADMEDVIELGNGRYLVRLRFSGRGRASGAAVTLEAAHVLTMRAGLLIRLVGYQSWQEGLEAVGVGTETRR